MGDEREDSDDLGRLCGSFCPWVYGCQWIGIGAGIAAAGVFAIVCAAGISDFITDKTGDPRIFVGVGCALLASGCGMAAVGAFRTGQVFEIRRGGVRYQSWLCRREMPWSEIEDIYVQKLTVVSKTQGSQSYYTVTLSSLGECIQLNSGFLRSVSPISVVQLLKLHSRRELTGAVDDIRVPEKMKRQFDAEISEDQPKSAPKRRKAVKASASSSPTPYEEAVALFASGATAAQVEDVLIGHGIPEGAAQAMIEKALLERVAEEEPLEDETEELKRQARRQLDSGIKADQVESWLRDQGVNRRFAAAMMNNLREERL